MTRVAGQYPATGRSAELQTADSALRILVPGNANDRVLVVPRKNSVLVILHALTSFGKCYFQSRIRNMGIEEVPIAPRSPWQNPYCERLLGSIRRDCLDHVIVLNEDHLRRILKAYFEYYAARRVPNTWTKLLRRTGLNGYTWSFCCRRGTMAARVKPVAGPAEPKGAFLRVLPGEAH